jgi:hypothetical protein
LTANRAIRALERLRTISSDFGFCQRSRIARPQFPLICASCGDAIERVAPATALAPSLRCRRFDVHENLSRRSNNRLRRGKSGCEWFCGLQKFLIRVLHDGSHNWMDSRT